MYKVNLQLFASEAITTSTMFPASDQVRIYFDVTAVEDHFSVYEGSIVSFDSFNFIKIEYTDMPGEEYRLYIDSVLIYCDVYSYWESTYETDGYIDIDMSEWNSNERDVTYVNSTALTALGITWENMNATSTWTVTYDSNGGSAVSSEEDIEDDGLATEPTDPTRSGYTFDGWYTDDGDFTDKWDFDTLYAKWTQSVENKFTQWGRAVHTLIKAPTSEQKNTDHTLELTDAGKVILATNAIKITIPLNSAVAFPINTEIAVVRYSAGTVTIGTSSGATLNGESSTTTFDLGDQYTSVAIKKVGTDTWIMVGAFEESE